MIVDVQATEQNIDLGATGVARIIQRVRMILSTVKGTLPLDRDFGVDGAPLDKPLPVAQALLSAGVVAAIEANEPMVTVLSVAFADDGRSGDGALLPVVRIKIEETDDAV